MSDQIKKVLRFISIYGFKRTLFKVAGRTGHRRILRLLKLLLIKRATKQISIIGCGQFAMATVGAVMNEERIGFLSNYDINPEAAEKFAYVYNSSCIKDISTYSNLAKLVYVTSNHATHTEYTCELLSRGHDVYVEKPVSVNWQQLRQFVESVKKYSQARVFVGYNRPFSHAVRLIKQTLTDDDMLTPFSLSCFVIGHYLDENHWYRKPDEGTRICGNLGHWLDLFIHILFWRKQPVNQLQIKITYSDEDNCDDNLVVSLVSEHKDFCSIMSSVRSEPFEGVNETINYQQADLIAKIDDFRQCQIWKNAQTIKKKYRIKDTGYKKSILRPFDPSLVWQDRLTEVSYSNILMLAITDMVVSKQTDFILNFTTHKELIL